MNRPVLCRRRQRRAPFRAAVWLGRVLFAFILAAAFALPAQAAPAAEASVFTATAETSGGDESSMASEYTLESTITLSGGQGGAALTDSNRSTFLKLEGHSRVTIECEQLFSSLYLIWDTPPSAFELQVHTAEGQRSIYQDDGLGFLHNSITLQAAATSVVLTLGAGDHTLCDIYLFGSGALPGWVQQWQPPLDEADLLCLPTHADDEHLFFGGILPTYAGQRQLAVQVAYLTNHFGERYRPHELLDGLWEVGVTAYPVMGPFVDQYAAMESLAAAEQVYDRTEVLQWQVEQLRRFKPRVVVGHDLNGEYGHGAHILNAETLLQAVTLAAQDDAMAPSAETYGPWAAEKLYLHLYPEGELVMNWDEPLERFGGATAFDMAVDGFAKHVSQQSYFSVQQSGTWQDCRRFGLAYTTVGPDTAKNDLFENIDLTPEPEPLPDSSIL